MIARRRRLTADERAGLVRVAFHECAHAVTARKLGFSVSLVDLTPSSGHLAAVRLGDDPPGMSALDEGINRATVFLAGDFGERVMTSPAPYVAAVNDGAEQAARVVARIAGLSPDKAAQYAAMHAADSLHEGDAHHAAFWACHAAPKEQETCLAFCRERAWRLVIENVDLITALVPRLLWDVIWTGDELEQAMTDLQPTGKEA
jgi:ATP-dependent Zn protease